MLRRAGGREALTSSAVACEPGATVVQLSGGGPRLRIPHRPFPGQDAAYRTPSARHLDGVAVPVWDDGEQGSGADEALWYMDASGALCCRADLISATLFLLGRWEELALEERDQHGRFPARLSWQVSARLLDRPLVDEYGLALEAALVRHVPGWQPAPRALRVMVSHDIDDTGYPRTLKRTAGHLLKRRHPVAALRDVGEWIGLGLPADLVATRRLGEMMKARGLTSSFYWKAVGFSRYDTGYDPAHPAIRAEARRLMDAGMEMGAHPGYYTFGDRAALGAERERLETALGVAMAGGRQHYLRWSPATWLDWEACGFQYDTSVGFADEAGFRAGTCWPYHPWSFTEDRALKLLEIPLVAMDRTLLDYMHLEHAAALSLCRTLKDRCARAGGVFTLLWHNGTLLEPGYAELAGPAMDICQGHPVLDWKAEQQRAAVPRREVN